IAIQSEAYLCPSAAHQQTYFAHAFRVWFGMMSAEQWVDLVMEDRELRAGLFEQCIEITATRAIHQLDGNFHFRAANNVELYQFAELFEISRLRIERLALEGTHYRRFDRPVAGLQFSDSGLDLFGHFGRGRCAVAGRKLQSLILGRIVAGG